jgi:hypothetical protein
VDHHALQLGMNMIVNNGEIQSAFNAFYGCWKEYFEGGYMHMTLPVVDCEDDPTTCAKLVGAVTVTVVHMTQDPNYKDLPGDIEPKVDGDPDKTWKRIEANDACKDKENPDKCVWEKFVENYGLIQAKLNPETDDYSAEYHAKSIYFLPHCEPHVPIGVTGGENFGMLAEIPVLVR